MARNKLYWDSGTFNTKESVVGLVRVPLFWRSHCTTCVPGTSCKGPIGLWSWLYLMFFGPELFAMLKEWYSVSCLCLCILGQKGRKTVRQLRKRGNDYKVGKQWKKTKITTNNFLARDLKVASVTMEMTVNILMMYICTLEHVTISAMHRKKLKLISSRCCHKQVDCSCWKNQTKSPVRTPKARSSFAQVRTTERNNLEIVMLLVESKFLSDILYNWPIFHLFLLLFLLCQVISRHLTHTTWSYSPQVRLFYIFLSSNWRSL